VAINAKAIRAWAQGRPAEAMSSSEATKGHDPDLEGEEMGDEEELEAGERNAIWAGEAGVEELAPEDAEELIAWLHESEPDIAQAIDALAAAVGGDPELSEHARSQLEAAEQNMVPEYPEFGPEQREALVAALEEEMTAAGMPPPDSPEAALAIANAISAARAGESDEEFEEEEGEELEEDAGLAMPPEVGA
jgi:hypothetical protein